MIRKSLRSRANTLMTATGDTTELLDRARRLGVLSAAPLPEDLPDDPAAATETLVANGWLTRFQADTLLTDSNRLRYGQYVLLSPLGEGGMGRVFLARHLDLNRRVAVKLLLDPTADPLARERFRREARAAAALDHPNIVRLYDLGREGDTEYLVMEAVDGSDLHRHLRANGPLPVGAAVGYIRQAAIGLAHAHERGIIHRDIKPANLMLTPVGLVKVLDLGLARSITEPEDALTSPGPDGGISGTVDYLSPEQAVNGPVDARTDVYGLGGTLAALLTGGPPYTGTVAQKLLRHQLAPPPDLYTETAGRVPRALADVVARMMAKRPDDRPASAAEVVRLLGPWAEAVILGQSKATVPAALDDTHAPTVRLPAGVPAVPTPPRRRAGLIVAGALLCAALLAVGVRAVVIGSPVADCAGAIFDEDTAPTREVVLDTDFRGFPAFARSSDAEDTGTAVGPDSPFPAGWFCQREPGTGAATFAATPGDAGTVLSASVAGTAPAHWSFQPAKGVGTALAPDTSYRVTVEYATDSAACLNVLEVDVWTPLVVVGLPAARGWATAEVSFVSPPARDVQFNLTAAADGKPLRVRRFRLERCPPGTPCGPPAVTLDAAAFGPVWCRMAGGTRVAGDGALPDHWSFQSYQTDGVAELKVGTDGGRPHVALTNVAGVGAQLYRNQPGEVLKAGVRHRVTVEYRSAAGTSGGFDLRDRDVENWADAPFVIRLPQTNGAWEARHYEITQPRDWHPVLVLQNHSAEPGNEFAVGRLTVTPLR